MPKNTALGFVVVVVVVVFLWRLNAERGKRLLFFFFGVFGVQRWKHPLFVASKGVCYISYIRVTGLYVATEVVAPDKTLPFAFEANSAVLLFVNWTRTIFGGVQDQIR